MQFNSYCYIAISSSMSQEDAQTYCSAQGAELVKITSAKENDFVLALARKDATARNLIWIGLEYSSTAEDFFWSDYSFPVYTNWAPGRPDENVTDQCVAMWTNLSPLSASGYWNDRPCEIVPSYLSGTVCKRLP